MHRTHAQSKNPDAVRRARRSPCVDQNSFLSAFPSKSIPPFGGQTAVSVPGRLPKYTYAHTRMHSCLLMCVMASAASLLTPHMLTGAYASLLAASTVWGPTVRERDRQDRTETDNQRHKGGRAEVANKTGKEKQSGPVKETCTDRQQYSKGNS